jgi:hypothetical protein
VEVVELGEVVEGDEDEDEDEAVESIKLGLFVVYDVEPARVLPGGGMMGSELEEDHEDERGSWPRGGAREAGSTGNRIPPINVVVPHSHCSKPSVIFLFAADRAAKRIEPAPRNEVNFVILSSKYLIVSSMVEVE